MSDYKRYVSLRPVKGAIKRKRYMMKELLFNHIMNRTLERLNLITGQVLPLLRKSSQKFACSMYVVLFFAALVVSVNLPLDGFSQITPASAANNAKRPSEKLNFIFIVADDLGWADLSGYGSDLHETPNLDRLASENLKFTNCYAASPVCSPTRASLLTGKYPARLHITTHFENSGDFWRNFDREDPGASRKLVQPTTVGNLPQNEITLAEALRNAGYFTAHVGKWHLGNFEHYPENQGFDVNIAGTAWGAPDTYWYPWTGNKFQRELRYIPGLELGSSEGSYLTDRLTDKAIDIIERKRDVPFFLHMSYHTPHTPMEGKPELVEYFRKKVRSDMKDKNYVYAAMIASLDENVGRILQKIEEAGIADQTVIMFLSDNGGRVGRFQHWETVANNSPLRSGKGSLYEGGIRIPLIIKWPGVTTPSSINDFPVITNDLYPTVLEIARLTDESKQNDKLDGVSIVPLLKNPSASLDRDILYWHYPHYYSTTAPVGALRKGNWKLLHYFEDNQLELYDLEEDLGERNNLVQKHPDVAANLYKALQTWRKDVDAQLPQLNSAYKSEN